MLLGLNAQGCWTLHHCRPDEAQEHASQTKTSPSHQLAAEAMLHSVAGLFGRAIAVRPCLPLHLLARCKLKLRKVIMPPPMDDRGVVSHLNQSCDDHMCAAMG